MGGLFGAYSGNTSQGVVRLKVPTDTYTASTGCFTILDYIPQCTDCVNSGTTLSSGPFGNCIGCDLSPTQTPTPTPTATVTPTVTVSSSVTPTVTPTYTPTRTKTPTVTPTFTPTRTQTPTFTPTTTPSVTQTLTPTVTRTPNGIVTLYATSCCAPQVIYCVRVTNLSAVQLNQFNTGQVEQFYLPPPHDICLNFVTKTSNNSPDIISPVGQIFTDPNSCDICRKLYDPSDCCCPPTIVSATTSYNSIPPLVGWNYSAFVETQSCLPCCDLNLQYSTVSPNGPWLNFNQQTIQLSCDSPVIGIGGPNPNSFPSVWLRVVQTCCVYNSDGSCPPAGDRSGVVCDQQTVYSNTYVITTFGVGGFATCGDFWSLAREDEGFGIYTYIGRYPQTYNYSTQIWDSPIQTILNTGPITSWAIYQIFGRMYFCDGNNLYEYGFGNSSPTFNTYNSFNPYYIRKITTTGGIIEITNSTDYSLVSPINLYVTCVKSVLGVQYVYDLSWSPGTTDTTATETLRFALPSGGTINGSLHVFEIGDNVQLPVKVPTDNLTRFVVTTNNGATFATSNPIQLGSNTQGPFYYLPSGYDFGTQFVTTPTGALYRIYRQSALSNTQLIFEQVGGGAAPIGSPSYSMVPEPPYLGGFQTIVDVAYTSKCVYQDFRNADIYGGGIGG